MEGQSSADPKQPTGGTKFSRSKAAYWTSMSAKVNVVAITDQLTLRVSEVLNVLRMMKKEGVELMDPLIITQSLSQSALPVESTSADFIVGICRSTEFLNDQLLIDILRVLKPGGSVFLQLTSQSTTQKVEKYTIERKLLLSGYLDVESSEAGHVIGVSGKKTSWKIGSSFSINKEKKSLPAVIIDDDMDLIDEDSLLTEEDLKKPQLPVGDCGVGKTRKACKNCSCGWAEAEAEQKVEKVGLTMDLLENPQSACGNLMTYSSTFLLPPPITTADNGPAVTYVLLILNQSLPRFTPLLWNHEQQNFEFVLTAERIGSTMNCLAYSLTKMFLLSVKSTNLML